MKKILISFLVMGLFISILSPNIFALENDNSSSIGYYDENGNYFNPETGEYFIWNQTSRSTARTFSFKIRANISSKNFTLNTTKVKIRVYNTYFENGLGNATSCCNNHWFEVDLQRYQEILPDTHNRANFYAPFSSKTVDLGGGFSTSEKYYVTITNYDKLPYAVYLVGNGDVYCY